jgi:IS30 family transposase
VGQRYLHLSAQERTAIEKLGSEGVSIRQIARHLGRSPSTISREVRRGLFSAAAVGTAYKPYRDPRLRSCSTVADPVYVASWAHHRAKERDDRSHQPTRMRHDPLVAYVCDKLRDGWTPQLIAGRLPIDHPNNPKMRVCAETLYKWIYSDQEKHRQLMDYLPRAHKRRRKKSGRRVHRSKPQGKIPISSRPQSASDRTEFGHWEGDSIVGATKHAAIRTEVERKTRYLAARLVPGTTSQAALAAQLAIFKPLPKAARKTTTCDNGSEHAKWKTLRRRLGVLTYFARPYHSWERGTNERANGLIRRYWPKKTNFEPLTSQELQDAINEINNRPMAVLGYHTPTEAFQTELHQLRSTPPALTQHCCTPD